MEKRKLTPEEVAEKELQKLYNRRRSGYKRSLKTLCREQGLRTTELQFEWLKTNPTTQLPKPLFDHAETVAIWSEAIAEYKEGLGQ